MEPSLPDLSQYWLEQSAEAHGPRREAPRTTTDDAFATDDQALAELVERVNAARGIA